jgi:hypothetical protein
MTKKYDIGEKRYLVVKKKDGEFNVTILEDGSDKRVCFPLKRWAQFVAIFPMVNQCLDNMRQRQPVSLQYHIGGRFYVSVTSGFYCVDVRQFYWNMAMGVRPTRKGIALRISEWEKLKEIVPILHAKFPVIAETPTCSSISNHFNQEAAFSCLECYPYQFENAFASPIATTTSTS